MRIAQIAPLVESVPPKMYGGTERVVSNLTEELVRRGHDVVLFASGDSQTAAELTPVSAQGLRLEGGVRDFHAYTMIQLAMVYGRAAEFDIIHNHVDYFAFPFARLSPTPTLTTLHGRLDLPEVRLVHGHFRDVPLVSISDAQRVHLPDARWLATVHNGIRIERFTFRSEPGRYLAFLGRIALEKRLDRAIEVARAVGMPLRVAAKVDPEDRQYYAHGIAPLMNHPLVEFVGEIDDRMKDEFLGNAYAYLFPVDWPEPFGISMVEAMATGTPVVATACGAVPEIVAHGVTGFVCRDLREMIDSVERVSTLSRTACRRHVEAHFSVKHMTDRYEQVYATLLRESLPGGPSASAVIPA
jgi:glycosyltransferase involved in cell wall biosynthesis